jgi:hypothetical protein
MESPLQTQLLVACGEEWLSVEQTRVSSKPKPILRQESFQNVLAKG